MVRITGFQCLDQRSPLLEFSKRSTMEPNDLVFGIDCFQGIEAPRFASQHRLDFPIEQGNDMQSEYVYRNTCIIDNTHGNGD